MNTVLSRIVLPSDKKQCDALYFRFKGSIQVRDDIIFMSAGTIVRFDTYFNAVPYSKYIHYSTVNSIRFSFRSAGNVSASLVCISQSSLETVLERKTFKGGAENHKLGPIELCSLPPDGFLFLQIEVWEDSMFFYGQFEAEQTPANKVRIATVICTYHREEYVERNCSIIQNKILNVPSSPIHDDLDIFIIDNGKSLCMEETNRIKIYPNKNYGGSGGFSRGMIEVLRCGQKYTHVLFMDDDVSFEPEVLTKTIQLLKYADHPYCVGGQMLTEDEPNIQYEAGGCYINGRLRAINRGLDMTEIKNLLKNNRENNVHYNAWWYCCIPLEDVRNNGLAMPFFIKEDDVEYGIRLAREFLIMNGIGIWHKAFSAKYSPHLEYYIKRNELIVSAIHNNYSGTGNSLLKLFRSLIRKIMENDHAAMQFIYQAYFDFLKGPPFFYQVEADRLNEELLGKKRSLVPSSRFSTIVDFLKTFPQLLCKYTLTYSKVQKQFQKEHEKLTSLSFWCKQLDVTQP